MTHDELLFKIYEIQNNSSDAGQEANKQYRGMIHFMQALLAVVELHKPHSGLNGNTCTCDPYDEYRMGYPCDTIQAIEKELQ